MTLNNDHDSITLMQQQANQTIVDDLFRRGFINQQARDCVSQLLYPHLNWGAFTTRFLGILGSLFVISGLVFYFAFNWERMSDSYKLQTLQAGIICCIAGAWAFSLSKLSGQLFLTAGCVLVGIFMAVFGQIYQTGADSYQLFSIWAVLIIPFVLIGRFPALWFLWIVILNFAIGLYWHQVVSSNQNMTYFLFFILIAIDCGFLALREYAQHKNINWCLDRWHRILLAISILLLSLFPIMTLIFNIDDFKDVYITSGALLGISVLFGFIYYYRFKNNDMWVVGASIITLCIILCAGGFKLFDETIRNSELKWLLMSVLTITIFTLGAFTLNKLSHSLSNQEKLL